jgi:hypothetical protein
MWIHREGTYLSSLKFWFIKSRTITILGFIKQIQKNATLKNEFRINKGRIARR